jgi:hypothetical protein
MSRVFTFLLALFSKLTRLFYFCKGLPFLCFSLVLFLVLLGLGFRFSLVPFWGVSFSTYSFVSPRIKLRKKHLWIKKPCWGKTLTLDWPPKLRPTKKTFKKSFLSHLLESVWVNLCFLMPCCFAMKGQNETPLGVTRGTSVNLPHHRGFVLTYIMKNEMSFVHHPVER